MYITCKNLTVIDNEETVNCPHKDIRIQSQFLISVEKSIFFMPK